VDPKGVWTSATYRVLAPDAGAVRRGLGATIDEALAAGVEAKDVWRAVCAEFDMPASLR
jgi:hypothetical protein